MKKAVIVLGKIKKLPKQTNVAFIGVDYGAQFLAEQGLMMDLAIGDFDSVANLDLIRQYALKIVILPCNKDDTDSSAALKAIDHKAYSQIELWGALGGRMDHELVNVALLYRYPGIYICDEKQILCVLKPQKYHLQKKFKYISFLSRNKTVLSAKGLKYKLHRCELQADDLFATSNEFLQDEITLLVEEGPVLCIQSQDK